MLDDKSTLVQVTSHYLSHRRPTSLKPYGVTRRQRVNWWSPTICRESWSAILHYDDVMMTAMASQITSLTIVYSTVYSGADQRKHQSSASLAFVRGIYRPPVNSPHKGPVTRKMFPFDDVIMEWGNCVRKQWWGGQFEIMTNYVDSYVAADGVMVLGHCGCGKNHIQFPLH